MAAKVFYAGGPFQFDIVEEGKAGWFRGRDQKIFEKQENGGPDTDPCETLLVMSILVVHLLWCKMSFW